eukprot:2764124-Rhodomonas_salina.1
MIREDGAAIPIGHIHHGDNPGSVPFPFIAVHKELVTGCCTLVLQDLNEFGCAFLDYLFQHVDLLLTFAACLLQDRIAQANKECAHAAPHAAGLSTTSGSSLVEPPDL